jgi:hypothetical protein
MEQKKLVTTFPFVAVEKKQHNHETEEIEFNFFFHHTRRLQLPVTEETWPCLFLSLFYKTIASIERKKTGHDQCFFML